MHLSPLLPPSCTSSFLTHPVSPADRHQCPSVPRVDRFSLCRWNDEGETYYFAFYYWNAAQVEGLTNFDSKKRFWSINRCYTPGMSRQGAVIWTGDIGVDWNSLEQQPGTMLNWGLAGVGSVSTSSV